MRLAHHIRVHIPTVIFTLLWALSHASLAHANNMSWVGTGQCRISVDMNKRLTLGGDAQSQFDDIIEILARKFTEYNDGTYSKAVAASSESFQGCLMNLDRYCRETAQAVFNGNFGKPYTVELLNAVCRPENDVDERLLEYDPRFSREYRPYVEPKLDPNSLNFKDALEWINNAIEDIWEQMSDPQKVLFVVSLAALLSAIVGFTLTGGWPALLAALSTGGAGLWGFITGAGAATLTGPVMAKLTSAIILLIIATADYYDIEIRPVLPQHASIRAAVEGDNDFIFTEDFEKFKNINVAPRKPITNGFLFHKRTGTVTIWVKRKKYDISIDHGSVRQTTTAPNQHPETEEAL